MKLLLASMLHCVISINSLNVVWSCYIAPVSHASTSVLLLLLLLIMMMMLMM